MSRYSFGKTVDAGFEQTIERVTQERALRVAAQRVPGVRRLEDHTFVMPPRLIGALGAQ